MKSNNKGSLLRQLTAAPKPSKRPKINKSENDDMVEPESPYFQDNFRSNVDNTLSFTSAKKQEEHVKSDSTKKKTMIVDSSSEDDVSQDFINVQGFNSFDKNKSQSNLSAKSDKKNDHSILIFPKNDNENAENRSSVPKSDFSVVPQANRSKQRASSNATTNEIIQKEKMKSHFILEKHDQNQKNDKYLNHDNQILEEKSYQNEDLIKKVAEPIRRRLVVNLPTSDFETRHIQVTTALDMTDKDVNEISNSVMEIHDSLVQLSRDSREISEKSMDLTQTTEAVMSKVNVMADWIDGLEKVGSGLKIQLIEWIVKFVSFLSSLLLLIYQTIRKANPLTYFRNKRKKNPPLKTVGDDENS